MKKYNSTQHLFMYDCRIAAGESKEDARANSFRELMGREESEYWTDYKAKIKRAVLAAREIHAERAAQQRAA